MLSLIVVAAVVCGVVAPFEFRAVAAASVGAASLALLLPIRARARVAVCVVVLTWAYGAWARDRRLESPLIAALGAMLDERPTMPVWLQGTMLADAAMEDDGVSLSVDVTRVRVDDGWRDVRGRASLSVAGALGPAHAAAWTRGRVITAPALLKRPQVFHNPGSPSDWWQRLRRPADVVGTIKSGALISVTRAGPGDELAARIRRSVRRAVRETAGRYSERSAAVITAILIGDRSSLDPAIVRDLQLAGTYHVIAISGGNIALVVVTVLLLARCMWRSVAATSCLALAAVLAYGAVLTDQPSVSRAIAAAAVVLLTQAAGWVVSPLRVFWLAAAVVVTIDPLTVIDPGAWLSFGATLGILLMAGRIQRVAGRRGAVAGAALGLFAATLSAELALLPISAGVFNRVGVAGLLLNFIAIPAMAAVELCGIGAVLLWVVGSSWAAGPAWIAHLGVRALVESAGALDWLPPMSWQVPPSWIGWTIGFYAFGALALTTRKRGRLAGAVATGACLLLIVFPSTPPGPPAGWLRVTMIDVGQGEAIAVQFPGRRSMLVDAGGSATGFDVGARVVEPALWALGIRKLDWLAVTHGDIDHAGGAASVLRDLRPDEVWEGVPVPRSGRMQQLRADAHHAGAAWERLTTGQTIEVGSVSVAVANPPLPDWERQETRNDDSLVLELRFGDVGIVLPGDIGAEVERGLVLDGRARLRLLAVPHHGSRTSSSPALVQGWRPHAALISVGRGNNFGHPAPEVIRRYASTGARVFRTDLDGAISIETDGRVVLVTTAAGLRWRLTAVH